AGDARRGQHRAEQRHQDFLGRRGRVDAADPDRLDLRHELQAHARARLVVRLSVRLRADGARGRAALLFLQVEEVAVAPMSEAPPRIRVVNPNSNEAVTRGLDEALAPLRFVNGPEIVCSTLSEGPFGVETQADVESVVLPLRRL